MTYSVLKVPLNPNQPTNQHKATSAHCDFIRRIVILFFALYKYSYLLTYLLTSCCHV